MKSILIWSYSLVSVVTGPKKILNFYLCVGVGTSFEIDIALRFLFTPILIISPVLKPSLD